MGQYYKYINLDKKIIIYPQCDSKLTEHSWLENNDVLAVKQLLKTLWKGDRVIHLGDYAEDRTEKTELDRQHNEFLCSIKKELNIKDSLYENETFKEYFAEEYFRKMGLNYHAEDVENTNKWTGYKWTEHIFIPRNEHGEECNASQFRYLYNTARKEWVDTFKIATSYVEVYQGYEVVFSKLDVYSLLIAMGNGEGGGDYSGLDEDKVGLWATTTESIIISEKSPKEIDIDDIDTYSELTPMFCECWDTEKKIHNIKNELFAFQDFLKEMNQAGKKDAILKLKVNTSGLCMAKYVQLYLEDFQNKIKGENT